MPDSLSQPRSLPPGRVLLTEAQIQARVEELGREITENYRGSRPLLLGVMNGALFFLTDLLRAVDLETEISCVRLASYAGSESTGKLRGLDAVGESFAGRRVLIVDDILDSGLTLASLSARLRELGAMEVKSCVLLEKARRRENGVEADWVGFRITNEFVVGYGLDFEGRYRGLRDIQVMEMD